MPWDGQKYRKEHRAEIREYMRGWRSRNRKKWYANNLIGDAIRNKKLIRPSVCEKCKSTCVPQAHHPDYEKPWDVVWLCIKCHKAEHPKKGTHCQKGHAFDATNTYTDGRGQRHCRTCNNANDRRRRRLKRERLLQ